MFILLFGILIHGIDALLPLGNSDIPLVFIVDFFAKKLIKFFRVSLFGILIHAVDALLPPGNSDIPLVFIF